MADAMLHTIKLPYPDKGDRNVWVYVPSHSDGEKIPVVYMTPPCYQKTFRIFAD